MKSLSIVLMLVVLAVNAATLHPAAAGFQSTVPVLSLVAAALALLALLAAGRNRTEPTPAVAVPTGAGAQSVPPPAPAVRAEAEVVGFLAALQEKGRLVDFLMDDITAYSDAQVGAAARVVHQGCRSVLDGCFQIRPLREEKEGAVVTVPAGSAADAYRLIGKITGQPPFSGTLAHRGWRTEAVKLPRLVRADDDTLPAIAPAVVELE
jgi:hypothetical protein